VICCVGMRAGSLPVTSLDAEALKFLCILVNFVQHKLSHSNDESVCEFYVWWYKSYGFYEQYSHIFLHYTMLIAVTIIWMVL